MGHDPFVWDREMLVGEGDLGTVTLAHSRSGIDGSVGLSTSFCSHTYPSDPDLFITSLPVVEATIMEYST